MQIKRINYIGLSLLVVFLIGCSSNSKKESSLENEPEFKISTKVLPEPSLKLYNHAVSDIKSGNLKEAERGLLLLEKTVKDSPGIYANLGVIAERSNDLEAAKKYYLKALEINAYNVAALNNLANIYVSDGDFSTAATYYKRGLRADEKNEDLLLNYAALNELYLHDLSEALSLYERYSDYYPGKKQSVEGKIIDLERRVE